MRVKEEIQIKKDTFLPKIKVKRNKQTPQPRNISAMIDSINKAKGVASTLQLTNQAPPKDTVIFDLKPGLKPGYLRKPVAQLTSCSLRSLMSFIRWDHSRRKKCNTGNNIIKNILWLLLA
jgi:hypothetical protein